MVTDVISKLANRGVFFLVTSRNSKFMTEDQLPASAIGKILLVHAILKSYGNSITISREECAAMCNMGLSTAVTNYARILVDNNLLDVTHEGRSVYYNFITDARDTIKPPVYIPLGALSSKAYLLTSPCNMQRLNAHLQEIKNLGILPDTGSLESAYLMLGYKYDKYIAQADWSWDTDVMAYFSTNRDHYKLKAVYLAMNDVKRLPNKFEVLKTDFWETCTPGFIAQCNAIAYEGTKTPKWEEFPPDFYDPETTDEDRFAIYSSVKFGSPLRAPISAPLATPLASLAKLKGVTTANKDVVSTVKAIKEESDAQFKEEVNTPAFSTPTPELRVTKEENRIVSGLMKVRSAFEHVSSQLASEESKDKGHVISPEDDKNTSEENLIDENGMSETNEKPKLNVKDVWPTCDFVPPEVEPDYGRGQRSKTLAELKHLEVREQLMEKLRSNSVNRTPYINPVGTKDVNGGLGELQDNVVDILTDIRLILDCNLPDRLKRVVLKNLLTK